MTATSIFCTMASSLFAWLSRWSSTRDTLTATSRDAATWPLSVPTNLLSKTLRSIELNQGKKFARANESNSAERLMSWSFLAPQSSLSWSRFVLLIKFTLNRTRQQETFSLSLSLSRRLIQFRFAPVPVSLKATLENDWNWKAEGECFGGKHRGRLIAPTKASLAHHESATPSVWTESWFASCSYNKSIESRATVDLLVRRCVRQTH